MTMKSTAAGLYTYPDTDEPNALSTWLGYILQQLEDAQLTPWATYTPVWTGFAAGQTPTTAARTRKIGRSVDLTIAALLVAAPTGPVTVTLPAATVAAPAGATALYGLVHAKDVSAGQYYGGHLIADAGAPVTVARVMTNVTTGPGVMTQVGPTAPFAWATNDSLYITARYEANA